VTLIVVVVERRNMKRMKKMAKKYSSSAVVAQVGEGTIVHARTSNAIMASVATTTEQVSAKGTGFAPATMGGRGRIATYGV
jgi:hypothetical protein